MLFLHIVSMIKKILTILIFSLFLLQLSSCRIKKGMQALEIYNYFDAKHFFEKSKKHKIVPASYGLSIIYQKTDNPFYNIDSAYNNIILAINHYSELKPKQKEKYQKLGIDSVKIIQQRDLITDNLYDRAKDFNSIIGYQDFIDKNPWSLLVDSAIFYRDSLFFYEVDKSGTSNDYKLFLDTYPDSYYSKQANHLYNKIYYREQTKDDKLISYIQFVKNNPKNPYVNNAQNRIFEIETQPKTENAYYHFITNYPNNPHVNQAWKLLYETYLQNHYSKTAISDFLKQYSDYPFTLGAKNELALEQLDFLPIKINNRWGAISVDGNYEIQPKYDYFESFSEGLAMFTLHDKVGYTAKTGEVKIKPIYDDGFTFNNGFAVVELNEKFGLINRVGEFIIEPEFEDLGTMNEGVVYFEYQQKYGYFDNKGLVRLKPDFSDASDFVNGKAIVAKNDTYGVIDKYGTTFLPLMFDEVERVNDSVYATKFDNWGLMTLSKDTLLPLIYSDLKSLNNGYILVENNDTFNFWNLNTKSFISEQWFNTYSEYKDFAKFVNGYAKIKLDEGYNFVDTLGRLKFSKYYDDLGEYATYVAFKKDGVWGYLTKNEKIFVKPYYDKTFSFNQVGGVVVLEPLKGVLGINKLLLLDVFYEDFIFVNDTIMITKSRGRYGLLTTNKDTILSFTYQLIEPFSNSLVKVTNDDWVLYYNFITNKWIKKED
jgi:hypothetical protein